MGEQQRVGFVRLFYQMPQFCVMDESTSALDIVSEARVARRHVSVLGVICVVH